MANPLQILTWPQQHSCPDMHTHLLQWREHMVQLNGNIESENGLLQVTNIMSPVLNRIILYTNIYNSPSRKAQNNTCSDPF